MPQLKPFRDYDEHDVINLFAYSGSNDVNKGTFVKIQSGWVDNYDLSHADLNGATYPNTVSLRSSVKARVTATTSGDTPLGMMLLDVKEVDENGEKLLYNPRKAAEMQCVISGQAVPIVTRGLFLYSGISGTVTAGASLYPGHVGMLTSATPNTGPVVAKALGASDPDGWVLIKLDL